MSLCRDLSLALPVLLACQERVPAPPVGSGTGSANPAIPKGPPIEVRGAEGTLATVMAGLPCRATVQGVEVLVGGRPLVAQLGATRWEGEDSENGTTLLANGTPLARIYARQLFDEHGAPVIRVLENGDIVNGAGQLIRRARVAGTDVTIGPAVAPGEPVLAAASITITNTNDVVLAAMLSARETSREIRALAACHFLLPDVPSRAP